MFSENNKNGLVYMTSSVITARHLFTTRYGGVSTGDFASLNLGSNRGDPQENVAENYRRVAAFFGVGRDDCAVTKQVHGNEVRVVTGADKHVCGSEHGVIAAVHCGWRSSVADILGVTVEKMCALGAEPESICAAMGASIGRCCFETDDDVPDAVKKYLGCDAEEFFDRRPDGKTMVDLRAANAMRLRQLGLRAENIDVSHECTMCSHEKYWSHRYTQRMGQGRGSLAAGIVLD